MRTSQLGRVPHGALPAFEGLVPWYRCTSRSTAPAFDIRTVSTIPGYYHPRVPEPLDQPTVPFWPRLLLQELICTHSSLRGSLLTKSDWLSQGVAGDPGHRPLLIEERRAMILPIDAQNTRCPSATLAFISLGVAGIPCPPASVSVQG